MMMMMMMMMMIQREYLTLDSRTCRASLYLWRSPLDWCARLRPLRPATLLSISFTAFGP